MRPCDPLDHRNMEKQREEVLFVRVESQLKSALEALADRNERSLSQQVRYLLGRELTKEQSK